MSRPRSTTDSDFVFAPGSEMWRVNRHWAGVIYGPAAAILQICHPRVAQGVAQHSDFENDTFGRLIRTLAATNGIAFGTWKEAESIAGRIGHAHAGVRGEIAEGMPGKVNYSAFEPELLMWVLATLIEASAGGHELIHGSLDDERREGLFQDFRKFGTFFGLDRSWGPQDEPAFRDYYQEMLADPELGAHPVCAEVAGAVVYPRSPWWFRPLGPTLDFLPIETLPAEVRERLGLRSTAWTRCRMTLFRRLIPTVFRVLPEPWRMYPEAWRAEQRLAAVASARVLSRES